MCTKKERIETEPKPSVYDYYYAPAGGRAYDPGHAPPLQGATLGVGLILSHF
jgi:hypothetical protein